MQQGDIRVDIAQDVQEIQPGAKVVGLSTGPVQGGVTVTTTNSEGHASSWLAWGQHVLKELVSLHDWLVRLEERLLKEIGRIETCIARLEERIHALETGTVGDDDLQRCADDVEKTRNRVEDLRAEFIEMRTKTLLIAAAIGALVGIVADVVVRRLLGA